MSALDLLAMIFILAGAFFFLAGTAGLLRFPDALSRLHALTKADNLGLGLIIVGLMLLDGSLGGVVKLLLIWLLALLASSSACYLLGRSAAGDDIGAVADGEERA
ncbi:MAG: monovalent cation/H(+) antiporter subunit G [Phycisphaeraceae bacterium]|nr:MAG: monovalent cation/H(+) antiporter subunit G [Phycisphaeraceae bacterium]